MARLRRSRRRRAVALRHAHLQRSSLYVYLRGICHFIAWLVAKDHALVRDTVVIDELLVA